ncbi:hypothetical protein [Alistipes onderdonkii]|uniref:hypothetical protein n=1 Tax=Alistipes onderdonkii TaxID=328813 RepID=UPI001142577B|nr:hypothetical protein [Alistipes onderdonkii]
MKRILLFVCCGLLLSCQKEFVSLPSELPPTSSQIITDGMTVLGQQLENPYSVENMRKALENLSPKTRAGITDMDIQPTHYYVKFHPRSAEELDILAQDSTIIWYEIPLDYEIEEYGGYYHDPTIPDSLPTYQYASIEVAKWPAVSNIGVEYEILSDLFIPDEDKDEEDDDGIMTRSGTKWNEALTDALVEESLRMTGNEEDGESEQQTRGRSKWRPAGRITAYDNIVGGAIPLNYVRVRARRWFTTHIGYTNANGYYSCNGRFKRPANYSIAWETSRWDIRDGNIVQAYYNGPKKTGNWDLYISANKSIRYATIHRALYRFYYGNTNGLKRPTNTRKEKIAYLHKKGNGINGDYNRQWGMGVWSDIRIYGQGNNGWREMSEVFSTACHELGHAAHYTNNRNTYGKCKTNLIESWARCVQYILTNQEYKELGVFNKLPKDLDFNVYNIQAWYKGYSNYTPLFIDLIDDFNQRTHQGNNPIYPDDEIHDMPVSVVQDIVFRSKTFSDVKRLLLDYAAKNKHAAQLYNLTPETINRLFTVYEN